MEDWLSEAGKARLDEDRRDRENLILGLPAMLRERCCPQAAEIADKIVRNIRDRMWLFVISVDYDFDREPRKSLRNKNFTSFKLKSAKLLDGSVKLFSDVDDAIRQIDAARSIASLNSPAGRYLSDAMFEASVALEKVAKSLGSLERHVIETQGEDQGGKKPLNVSDELPVRKFARSLAGGWVRCGHKLDGNFEAFLRTFNEALTGNEDVPSMSVIMKAARNEFGGKEPH
ncbi:MAG: hypothetical protein KDJ74_04660 [Notoacmeibacter sp.]|nr:hypothetical protein [Notoacmeibacter sp.]